MSFRAARRPQRGEVKAQEPSVFSSAGSIASRSSDRAVSQLSQLLTAGMWPPAPRGQRRATRNLFQEEKWLRLQRSSATTMCSPNSQFFRRRPPLHRSSPGIEVEVACPTARGALSVLRHLVGKKPIVRMTVFIAGKLLLYRVISFLITPNGLFTQREIGNLRDDDLSKSLESSPDVVEV